MLPRGPALSPQSAVSLRRGGFGQNRAAAATGLGWAVPGRRLRLLGPKQVEHDDFVLTRLEPRTRREGGLRRADVPKPAEAMAVDPNHAFAPQTQVQKRVAGFSTPKRPARTPGPRSGEPNFRPPSIVPSSARLKTLQPRQFRRLTVARASASPGRECLCGHGLPGPKFTRPIGSTRMSSVAALCPRRQPARGNCRCAGP